MLSKLSIVLNLIIFTSQVFAAELQVLQNKAKKGFDDTLCQSFPVPRILRTDAIKALFGQNIQNALSYPKKITVLSATLKAPQEQVEKILFNSILIEDPRLPLENIDYELALIYWEGKGLGRCLKFTIYKLPNKAPYLYGKMNGLFFKVNPSLPTILRSDELNNPKLFDIFANNQKAEALQVISALKVGNPTLRTYAARYMGESGNKEFIAHLIEALSDNTSHKGTESKDRSQSTTRQNAYLALKKLTGKDFAFDWNAKEKIRRGQQRAWEDWLSSQPK